MSYQPERNSDSLSEMFSSMSDSLSIIRKMEKNISDVTSFMNWFEKAVKIDVRFVRIWFRNHEESLAPKLALYVKNRLKMNGKGTTRRVEDYVD